MLYELFSWVHRRGDISVLQGEPLSLVQVEAALNEAMALQRKLIASLWTMRFSKANHEQEADEVRSALETNQAYQRFLNACKDQIASSTPMDMSQLALNYLNSLEDKPLRTAKINELFSYVLILNESRALSLYHRNEASLDNETHVQFVLHRLSEQLKYQNYPLGVARLMFNWVDDVLQFTGGILWLLKHGVTPAEIMTTGLIHHFFDYHVAFLDSDEDSFKRFIQLLEPFPEADEVIQLAKRTGAHLRGFEEFSLTGDRLGELLIKQVVCIPRVHFSISRENAFALYDLFQSTFLLEALNNDHRTEEAWKLILKELLNHKVDHSLLSRLLSKLAGDGHYDRLEAVGSLLEDSTGEQLLKKDLGGVFHLLPYKPALYERLGLFDPTNYLNQLNDAAHCSEDVIAQLATMIKALQKTNQSSADLVYQALVTVITHHPEYLSDEPLLKLLRRYPRKNSLLQERADKLSSQFRTCVAEASTSQTFGEEQYYTIEDTWKEISRQLSVLDLIGTITTSIPRDKYGLYILVTDERFAHQAGVIDYKALTRIFRLVPELNPDSINEYERYLIELLIALDDESIRTQILAALNCKYKDSLAWVRSNYGGRTLLIGTVERRNVGLLRWLLSDERALMIQDKEIAAMLVCSAQLGFWSSTELIIKAYSERFDKRIIKKLLFMAAEQGELAMVQQLIELEDFNENTLQSALVKAVEAGHAKVAVDFLSKETRAPRASSFTKGFKEAFLAGSFPDANFFVSYMSSPSMQNAVHQLLIHSVIHKDKVGIEFLCALECNEPKQNSIEQAFEEAAKVGAVELLALFCNSKYQPTLPSIERALNHATNNGHEEALQFICETPKARPTKAAIGTVLKLAAGAGHLAIVRYLYSYEVRPSRSAISQALNQAQVNQHHETAAFLNNPRHVEAYQQIDLGSPLSIVGFFSSERLQRSCSVGSEPGHRKAISFST